MSTLRINTSLVDVIQKTVAQIGAKPGLYLPSLKYADRLDLFGDVIDAVTPRVTQLSSTKITLAFSAESNWTLSLAGKGISPVGNIQTLIEAIQDGVAKGEFDSLTLKQGKTTLMNIDFSPTGYTLKTGTDTLRITGSLPDSMDDIYAIAAVVGQIGDLEDMTPSQREQLADALSDYGITGLSLTNATREVFSFSLTEDTLALKLFGYTLQFDGVFPTNFGEMLTVGWDLLAQLGEDPDLSSIAGLALDGMKLTAPDGTTLMNLTGPLDTSDPGHIDRFVVDGVRSPVGTILMFDPTAEGDRDNELIMGTWGRDGLSGNGGRDHLIGYKGNDMLSGGTGADTLVGSQGNDSLYGGSQNDRLEGGVGRDVLTGGKGADHFVFGNGSGRDTITDYRDGTDKIVIGWSRADSFADLTITDTSLGARITDGKNIVILHDVAASVLDAGDFIFA